MTDTKTIDELKAELEALKAEQKEKDELESLKQQINDIKEGKPQYKEGPPGVSLAPTERDVKQAAVRQVVCGFTHALFGPGASIYYSAKTGYWLPTLAATGSFFVAVPLALVDFGFTAAVAPPTVSALMVITQSQEKRRRLGITMPEQADAMLAKFRTF